MLIKKLDSGSINSTEGGPTVSELGRLFGVDNVTLIS